MIWALCMSEKFSLKKSENFAKYRQKCAFLLDKKYVAYIEHPQMNAPQSLKQYYESTHQYKHNTWYFKRPYNSPVNLPNLVRIS